MPYSKEAMEVLRQRALKKKARQAREHEQRQNDPVLQKVYQRECQQQVFPTDNGPVLKRLDRWRALLKEVVSRPYGLRVNASECVQLKDKHQKAKDLRGMIKEGWVDVVKKSAGHRTSHTVIVPKKTPKA